MQETTTFQAEIKQTEPMTVAFLSMRGPYSQIPSGFDCLYTWLKQRGHQSEGMPHAVYVSGITTPESEAVYELWAPIEGGATEFGPDDKGLGIKQVEAQTVAAVVHRGPYDALAGTYTALVRWIDEHGYAIDGPSDEMYLNGPGQVSSPEEYMTEVRFPVRQK